jgi:hypothetical protein
VRWLVLDNYLLICLGCGVLLKIFYVLKVAKIQVFSKLTGRYIKCLNG